MNSKKQLKASLDKALHNSQLPELQDLIQYRKQNKQHQTAKNKPNQLKKKKQLLPSRYSQHVIVLSMCICVCVCVCAYPNLQSFCAHLHTLSNMHTGHLQVKGQVTGHLQHQLEFITGVQMQCVSDRDESQSNSHFYHLLPSTSKQAITQTKL